MKKIIIVLSEKQVKRLYTYSILLTFLLLIAFTLMHHTSLSTKEVSIFKVLGNKQMQLSQEENTKLKETITSIFPKSQRILYENPFRAYGDKTYSLETLSTSEVIDKGKVITYQVLFSDPEYSRILFDSAWRDFYYRGWLYLPRKLEEAHHRLFEYQFGGSANFDFLGSLSFNEEIAIDYHRYLNFIIYQFDVKGVKLLNNQLVLLGVPKRRGAQVISIERDLLLQKGEEIKDFLYQLATPQGYEIDFLYGSNATYSYIKRQIEENSVQANAKQRVLALDLNNVEKEKNKLITELSNYIPIDSPIEITHDDCRQIPSNIINSHLLSPQEMVLNGNRLEFNISFEDNSYRRPLYTPIWQLNYRRGWAYIPRKLCNGLHNLFIIPSDDNRLFDFVGNHGLNQKLIPINASEIGFLSYNFTVESAYILNNQILFTGIPSRTGLQIITLDSKDISPRLDYLVQLATLDNQEIDYIILSRQKP